MIVGICKLELFLPETHSLKEKRQILRKIIGRTSEKFGVNVAEVDHQDLWQRAALGFAVVGSDGGVLSSLLDRTIRAIEEMDLARITDRTTDLVDF
ncbi:MAG TPA: DUF503 domain-containing protein [bacterium]|nr:DUF503 domain-containing protein [bacterium]